MTDPQWTSIFQAQVNALRNGDSWNLEFDDTLVPESPNFGWKQYIRNTSAWFHCSGCGRGWPSNRVMVVFHMHLSNGQGLVKVRRFRQECKMCDFPKMEEPEIETENIRILMENLVKKIRIKCYHEDLGEGNNPFVNLHVQSPHEPDHCEACRLGICTRD